MPVTVRRLGAENATTYQPMEEVEDIGLPTDMRNYAFAAVYWPMSWEWLRGEGFFPCLGEITAHPGVNGTGEKGSDGWNGNINAPAAGIASKGGLVIRPDDSRLGQFRNYIRKFPVRGTNGKGAHYCYSFVEYAVLPNGRARAIVDDKAWNAFRSHLVSSGIVPPMPAEAFADLIDRKEKALERLKRKAAGSDHWNGTIQQAEADIQQMKADWDALCDAVEVVDQAPNEPTPKAKAVRLKPAPADIGLDGGK